MHIPVNRRSAKQVRRSRGVAEVSLLAFRQDIVGVNDNAVGDAANAELSLCAVKTITDAHWSGLWYSPLTQMQGFP